MVIKQAAFVFGLLSNKLAKSNTIKTIKGSWWTNSNRKAGFDPVLDRYKPKTIQIVIIWVFIKKKFYLFYVNQRTKQLKSKLTVDRSNLLSFLVALN